MNRIDDLHYSDYYVVMFDQFDEAELLALVDGELDPKRADALRQRLARDPHALNLIDRLTADRTMLRTEHEPELPVDFLAELEPLMARPMLMGPSPAELRRQHRRRSPWGLVAAAAVAIVVLGGLWAVVSGVLSSSTGQTAPGLTPRADRSTEPVLPTDGGDETLLAFADSAVSGSNPPASTPIRDEAALDVAMGDAPGPVVAAATPSLSKSESGAKRAIAFGDEMPAADFVLSFQADDVIGAEQSMQQAIAELGLSIALVRNFSYEEAQRLEQEWLLSGGPGGPQIEVRRSDDLAGPAAPRGAIRARRDLRVLADRARQQMRVRRADLADDDLPTSEQLFGPTELAPSFETQLELSSRGAAYTITIPANQLGALLARLAVARGETTVLRMLSPDDALGTAKEQDARSRWLSDYAQVRGSAARLVKERGEGMILLPVVIEHSPKR